ncbi:MAG: ABC transporter permease, partial [Flavobacterium sp.]|nr:ABC transporter permease [Aeromicrobium sp.]
MRSFRWFAGLIRRRPVELIVAATSIALTIAFVASLGAFVTQSHSALTVRAAASVQVDWQVQITPQGSSTAVSKQLRKVPDVRTVEPVSFARVKSLSSTGAQGVRHTGAAYLVSISPTYATRFPGEVRHLLGGTSGSMLFQQTAANLATEPGGAITVQTTSGSRPLT